MDFIKYLRGWIAIVSLMALGNTIACFTDISFLYEKLYTTADGMVNRLLARMFGVWTLLASVLRLYCAIHIHNLELYNITVFSFVLAFVHFLLEAFVYRTAALTAGLIIPLIVSGGSLCAMIIGYSYHPAYQNQYGTEARPMSRQAKRSLFQQELIKEHKIR